MRLLTLLGLSFAISAGATGLPPWDGLPPTISPTFLDEEGFLPFEEISEAEARRLREPKRYTLAPIATDFLFDGQTVSVWDRAGQHLVFSEETFAHLPVGAPIAVRRDAQNREVWDYPVGFAVSHVIRFRDDARTPYEVRLVKKIPSGAWAYGVYEPAIVDGARQVLKLNTYEGWPEVQYQVHLSHAPTPASNLVGVTSGAGTETAPLLASRVVDVKLKRVKLDTCQGCHFANSIADYQYEVLKDDGRVDFKASAARTGPCGFVPGHPTLKSDWAARYETAHPGEPAFREEAPTLPTTPNTP